MTVDTEKRDRVISDAVRVGKIAASAAPEFRRRWDRWPLSTEAQIEETPPELKNPFAECELANPFRDDTQCAQVRAARAQTAARAVR